MRWILAVLLAASPAFAQSPCDGRITDQLAHPMDPVAVAKPAQGECYTDPAFGTRICRVGNADPSEGTNAIVKTNYNSTWGWNADESLIYLWHRGGRIYEIFQGDEPYAHVMTVHLTGSATTGSPTDIEHVIWDAHDPNVLWYPSNYQYSTQTVPKLYKVTLDAVGGGFSQEMFRDFSTAPTNCDPNSGLSLGHSHDMSIDGRRMLGLSCGNSLDRKIILYSITDDQVYGVRASPSPATDLAPNPFLSGNGAYFDDTAEVMDTSLNTVRTLTFANPREHQVMGLAGTEDRLDRVNFDEIQNGSLVSYSMATGAMNVVIGTQNSWPYPPSGTHPSLTPRNGSAWVAVGSFGSVPLGQGVLQNEIYLGNLVTGEVCRVAHARTAAREGPWGYWAETHPQISNDGYRVLFNSDWMGGNTVDAYVVDLRDGVPPPDPDPTYSATLTWTDGPDEDGTRIERSLEVVPRAFAAVGQVGQDITTYIDEPLSEGAYCWRLVWFNDGGDSPPGPEACEATAPPPDPPQAPGAPTIVVTPTP